MSLTTAQATAAGTTSSARPTQGTFTNDEQDFLRKYLDEYLAIEADKKGDKKRWVKTHVYGKFITEFKSDRPEGPNLSSLLDVRFLHHNTSTIIYFHVQKITRWYSNRATTRGVQSKPIIAAQPSKKPRATNAEGLFAKSHQEELRAATSSKLEEDGSTAPGTNLVVYRDVKKEAYSDLSPEEKAKWQDLVKEHNDRIQQRPTAEYIFK